MSTQYIISRKEGHPTRFQKHDFEMKVAEIGPPSELIGSILRHLWVTHRFARSGNAHFLVLKIKIGEYTS